MVFRFFPSRIAQACRPARRASPLRVAALAAAAAFFGLTVAPAPAFAQAPGHAQAQGQVHGQAQGPAQAHPSPPAPGARGVIDVAEHPARPVVVELFSSQSCGNCPEANRNVALLAERSDVIALTYPVGLWDYLGWDDTFAKPEFSERQIRYNRALGQRGPYTPQIIFGGRYHSSGVNLARIAEGFAQRDLKPYPAAVAFTADGVEVNGPAEAAGEVILIRYRPGVVKVTPGKGANRGKDMSYFNLVTSYESLGKWSGGPVKFAASCAQGCVALVQAGGGEGRIVGAGLKR